MPSTNLARMNAVLQSQRAAFLKEGTPGAETRKGRLQRAIGMLITYQDRIAAAVRADFGTRSAITTKAAEILSSVGALGYALQCLDRWMIPEIRDLVPETAGPGARAEIHRQPVGVVGVISPWNAPFLLSVSPLAGILAAGNRAMIKPSELTPASSELLAQMVGEFFDESELAVFSGGQDVAEAFSGLPFDHLMFTGSARVARQVMKRAAENLVPVTLELGGKSPVIVGSGCDIDMAATRIVHGKLLNAGQICISPDYVLVPKARREEFVAACRKAGDALYPTIADNEDYTSIITDRHYQRALDLVADAKAQGARVVVGSGGSASDLSARRKMPLHLVMDVSEGMRLVQEEIFAPVLPVITYDALREAIDYVNRGARPLALYFFGDDENERNLVIHHTWSGNIAMNDVVAQGLREEIPYGGIGASGIGCYKGIDGFRNFSHAKPVFYQTAVDDALKPLRPPYSDGVRAFVDSLLKGP